MQFRVDTFFNPYLPVGTNRVDALLTVTADGEGPAVKANVVVGLIIDTASSIDGEQIKAVKHATQTAIKLIDETNYFFIVAFSSHASHVTKLVQATSANKAAADTHVKQLEAGGWTVMSTGLSLALAEYTNVTAAIKYAIFLTAGKNDIEDEKKLDAVLSRCEGVFQCDCRGIGTDWQPKQLHKIARKLLGTAQIIAQPSDVEANIKAAIQQTQSRDVGDVWLRLRTPKSARVVACKQVSPEIVPLLERAATVDARTQDFPTGAWGTESRDYHVAVEMTPGDVGDEILSCHPSIVYGAPGQKIEVIGAPVVATWTDDEALSARINVQVAHSMGQEELVIAVTPPPSNCPHCAANLLAGATECRRCGERIRLCPVCRTLNTWLAKVCRLSQVHVLRTENDWRMSPGGDSTHALASSRAVGTQLARRWSFPPFAPVRAAEALEWSAPLAAFGMVIASGIDTAGNKAALYAFELASGAALWDFDLPDASGLYPDRGGMALSEDGLLYAATLGGSVLAMDAIRGTRRWETKVSGPIYGGLTLSADLLVVPAGDGLAVLDRLSGLVLRTLPLGGQSDTAPAVWGGGVFVAGDTEEVRAFNLTTGAEVWRTKTDGPFDAAPLVRDGVVYAATMAGTVYALQTATGEIKWQTSVSSRGVSVTPALSADGLLFAACDDGFLHVVASGSGNLIRSKRVSSAPLRSSPVCSGSTVFAGADDGFLYSLDGEYVVRRAYETSPGTRLGTAGLALYGDVIVCAATNGVLYVLQATL